MPRHRLTLAGPDVNPDPLEPGTYHVRVEHIDEGQTRAGAPSFTVKMTVVEGEQIDAPVIDRFYDTPAAQFRLRAFLEACGVDIYDGAEWDSDALAGTELLVTLTSQDDRAQDGTVRVRTRVAFVGAYAPAPDSLPF